MLPNKNFVFVTLLIGTIRVSAGRASESAVLQAMSSNGFIALLMTTLTCWIATTCLWYLLLVRTFIKSPFIRIALFVLFQALVNSLKEITSGHSKPVLKVMIDFIISDPLITFHAVESSVPQCWPDTLGKVRQNQFFELSISTIINIDTLLNNT